MIGQLAHQHIREQLKKIHIIAIILMVLFFGLIFFLGLYSNVSTLRAQIILLIMAAILTLGYFSLIPEKETEPKMPLVLFFILNLASTALVWATGLLYSPFIILYVVIILISSQLYSYIYGLLQTFLAIFGFVFVYGATTSRILSFSTILSDARVDIFYQPIVVIVVYGLLYALLLVFVVFSSSSARTLLFRPQAKNEMDSTYQEKIIQDMPTGVLIVDSELNILGSNPAAQFNFPFRDPPCYLGDYLSLAKVAPHSTLNHLVKNSKEKALTWKLDTGEIIPVTVSARILESNKNKNKTYILFLQ